MVSLFSIYKNILILNVMEIVIHVIKELFQIMNNIALNVLVIITLLKILKIALKILLDIILMKKKMFILVVIPRVPIVYQKK